MFCTKCGAEILDNSRFCTKCGATIKEQSHEVYEKNYEEKNIYISEEDDDYNNRQNYKTDANRSYKEDRYSDNVTLRGSNKKMYIICSCIALVIALTASTAVYMITNKNSSKAALSEQKTIGSDNTKKSGNSKDNSDTGAKNTNKSEAGITDTDKSISNKSNDEDVIKHVEHNHTYKVIKQNFTWDEAKEYCEQQGGHLATITDAEESEKVNDLINKTDAKVIWLGADDLNYNGEFEWVTGEDFSYSYWGDGEPNNDGGIEHYLVLYKVDKEWVWNDGPVDTNTFYDPSYIGFVCEWDD